MPMVEENLQGAQAWSFAIAERRVLLSRYIGDTMMMIFFSWTKKGFFVNSELDEVRA